MNEYGKEKRSRIYIRMLILIIFLLTTDIAFNIINSHQLASAVPLKLVECLKACCGPILLILLTDLIITTLKEKTTVSKAAMNAVYIAIIANIFDIISTILSLFFPIYYRIDENNHFVRQDWFIICYIYTFICITIITAILIIYRRHLTARELIALLSYVVIPELSVLFHLFVHGSSVMYFAITITAVLYFASIQSELSKQIKQKEIELTQNKIAIMLTQIQPHFLYNALSAITLLCTEDAEQAKQATINFASYLRANMESLSDQGLISIEKEISHVKGYLELEKAIYGRALNIIYEIDPVIFSLPPLTIQPIVENAVKHGIGKKENGGTITVSVKETAEEYLVTITDDGVGYDLTKPYPAERLHIGIENVRSRLKEQSGAVLRITSAKGLGTTAVMVFPKGKS